MINNEAGVDRKRKRQLRADRTPTSRFGYDQQSASPHISSPKHSNTNKNLASSTKTDAKESEADIAATLDFRVGDEIYFNGRIHDNDGYSGEILSIEEINKGSYVLKMANHCHGLWGENIKRSASKMKKLARRVQEPHDQCEVRVKKEKLWFIPIVFSIQSAVFDSRSKTNAPHCHNDSDHAAFMNKALDGWHFFDSWRSDVWTVEPLLLHELWPSGAITYSILFLLLKDVLEGGFKPHTDENFDAFFILPPAGGSALLLKDYIKACERQDEQFVVSFEYIWIFVDKRKRTVKEELLKV
mmetsp:Transcript_22128/g.37470  ORF Transcript_22128/g.37470 Transcript_22128/m.37470 type:complete len:299 (-) Transcript_22128:108-1004(-)